MQLSLSGHHVEITPALRSYVEKKVERVMRHFDHVIDAHCVLTVEKLRRKAEATLHLRGETIHALAEDENMYAAIDALADKLDRRVRKHKEKATDHHAAEAQKSARL
jgi:putative sigma-54 modulation protein